MKMRFKVRAKAFVANFTDLTSLLNTDQTSGPQSTLLRAVTAPDNSEVACISGLITIAYVKKPRRVAVLMIYR